VTPSRFVIIPTAAVEFLEGDCTTHHHRFISVIVSFAFFELHFVKETKYVL